MARKKKALVTGSGGLVGSECVRALSETGWDVVGADNNMREEFFGADASVGPVLEQLREQCPGYRHTALDVRDRDAVRELMKIERPDFIIHTAGQPSHDRAAEIPYLDFDVNATGTVNLLVAARDFCKESPFCFTSTNKVYGDGPNEVELTELETRYEFADRPEGIDESFPVDQCLHSVFGASKLAADVMCQEFGRYFDMPVGVFRAGCLTGPQHAAVSLHGYLAYIVKCAATGAPYTILGYKGKQVRDQLHCRDVASLFMEYYKNPRAGEAYNMGGGKGNSLSILETIDRLDRIGLTLDHDYREENRVGDHICYYSDLSKIREHFPAWRIGYGVDRIIDEIAERYRTEPAPLRSRL